MEITIESKYGKVVGEVIGNYSIRVHVESEEYRGYCAIDKNIKTVTDDDLLKACEEIMAREIVEEE